MSIERLRALEKAVKLVAKATPGPWRFYEEQLRPDYPVRVMEVQQPNGAAVIPWAGFDSADQTKTTKRANAKAIIAAVNFIREHGSALIAELGQEVGAVAAPEGWALVPQQMALTPKALGLIETMCAGPDHEGIGGEGGEYRWCDGILWVGETEGDNGEKYWGLNIACVELLEEGSVPVCEFARPTSPAHTSEARDAARWKWLSPRILCADFAGDEFVVLTFELPAGSVVYASAEATIDAAMRQEAE